MEKEDRQGRRGAREVEKGESVQKKWESFQCALRMFSFLSASETGTKVINLSSVLTRF